MVQILAPLCLLFTTFTIYKIACFVRNIRLAKATGLPYTFSPILEFEVYGYITTPILRLIYNDYLKKNQGWPKWARFMIKDWPFEDKRRAHEEFGDVFLVVAPGGLICYSADAKMGNDVMLRRNDFTKPPDKYRMLEPYGPNVATAEGKLWRFHVRITAPPFGDISGVNDLVWSETLWQTKLLSSAWSRQSSRELHLDVNSLTLGVISRAGFGKRLDWSDSSIDTTDDIPPGHKLSFLRAINDTTKWMIPILLLPGWLLNLTPWKSAHKAHTELEAYMREMISSEKKSLRKDLNYQSANSKGNLLTAVMKASASEAVASNKTDGGSKKETFTDDEVLGNLFIYLLAGYETTANAIIYGLITLALDDDLQTQVMEEIDQVYDQAAKEGREELSYAEDFEKLQITFGFMYEVLRVYPGVVLITKMVTQHQRIITSDINGNDAGSYILPPGTRVYLSSPGVHYHEKYWTNPYKIDPTRWVTHSEQNGDKKKVSAANKTNQLKGTFLTFSDGARACLGKKFAQAEYVAFFAGLLREYRVRLGDGLSREEVGKDLLMRCAGSITLAPVDNVGLALERRQK